MVYVGLIVGLKGYTLDPFNELNPSVSPELVTLQDPLFSGTINLSSTSILYIFTKNPALTKWLVLIWLEISNFTCWKRVSLSNLPFCVPPLPKDHAGVWN